MKKEKWICNDISLEGESLIQNENGCYIAEVYHSEDVNLIKSAPDLLRALQAVYKDIELQNVKGGSDELNFIVQQAIKKATGQ